MFKIVVMIYFTMILSTWAFNFNCELPMGCEINDIHYHVNYFSKEKTAIEIQGIRCNVLDENFQFNYSMKYNSTIKPCRIYSIKRKQTIEFRFHRDFIFGKWFNISNFLNYGSLFRSNINFNFVNLKGFDLNVIDSNFNPSFRNLTADFFYYFNCINCKIEFYSNGRPIKTCQEITNSINQTSVSIMSLFQFSCFLEHPVIGNLGPILTLYDPHFKSTICPLMFNNSLIYNLNFISLVDTFYKRNILTFENQIFNNLNSTIKYISIHAENVNIDSSLLHPSVFKRTVEFHLYGKLNRIDEGSIGALKSLNRIIFSKEYFRDMIHKNGIKWISGFNPNLRVNLSNLKDIQNKYGYRKKLFAECTSYIPEIRLSKVFPDEDFCLYKDFPFNQLVILSEFVEREKVYKLFNSSTSRDYTCTYLWLAQYFEKFLWLNVR